MDFASEKLAEDIVMLDLRQVASFADYFVIMSASSARQIEALEEDISKALKDSQVSRFHREGSPASGWADALASYSWSSPGPYPGQPLGNPSRFRTWCLGIQRWKITNVGRKALRP